MPAPIAWDRIADFIGRYLPTFEHLEVLLLAARSPERYVSAAEAAHALGIDAVAAGRALEDLAAANLLDVKLLDDVRYRLRSQAAAAADIAELQTAYAAQRVRVVNEIMAGRSRRIRDFADAFRIHNDEEPNG